MCWFAFFTKLDGKYTYEDSESRSSGNTRREVISTDMSSIHRAAHVRCESFWRISQHLGGLLIQRVVRVGVLMKGSSTHTDKEMEANRSQYKCELTHKRQQLGRSMPRERNMRCLEANRHGRTRKRN